MDPHSLHAWSDGSLMDGVGGAGWFIETHSIRKRGERLWWHSIPWNRGGRHLGASCDICLVELWAALLMIECILRALNAEHRRFHAVHLTIDNKPVVNWLAGNTSAQHDYVLELVERVYVVLHELHTITEAPVSVQWCKRGVWPGNNAADTEAKKAVRSKSTAIPANYIAFTHGATRTDIKRQLGMKRRDEYERAAMTHDHLLSREFFKWNLTKSATFRPRDDHKMLTLQQSRIITQLRTGHSDCFFSHHVLMHYAQYKAAWAHCNGDLSRLPRIRCVATCCADNNNGICAVCDVWETEEHFLLHCPSHDRIRRRTFGRFLRLYRMWREPVSLKSLLFPPLCFKWKHRKMILAKVVVFCLETGRFKRW